MGMLYCYVRAAPYAEEEIQSIETNMDEWGACTQNFTNLAEILNQTTTEVNDTIWTCATELNDSSQLGLARTSLIYQLLASMFFSEMPLVASIHQDRNLYIREHASRSYSSFAWSFSWICRIAFSGLLKGVIFPPFVYFSAQLSLAIESYVLFSIFMGIMSVMGASVALLVSVIFQSFETASVAFVVVNIVSQNLCGYFISESYIPWWFRWFYYMNFFTYTFRGTVLSQRLTESQLNKAIAENQLSTFQSIQEASWVSAFVAVVFCIGIQTLCLAIVQFTGQSQPCRSSSNKPQNQNTRFSPVQIGGGFTLTTFGRNEAKTEDVVTT